MAEATIRNERAPFDYTEEQTELRSILPRFSAQWSSPARIPKDPSRCDPRMWAQLTEQLGLTAILVPERHGGMGGTWVDLAISLEETGAALLSTPYFATAVLGTTTILLCEDERANAEYLPAIAAGTLRSTLAVRPEHAAHHPVQPAATATGDGATWTVSASGLTAIDGEAADLIPAPLTRRDAS